jgi:predicted DNA-binding transcriptional regulator AlpA
MTPTLLRYSDLKARGIVRNWVTLLRWIAHEDFPPGKMLGPNTRAWTDAEVAAWLESRPTPRNANTAA